MALTRHDVFNKISALIAEQLKVSKDTISENSTLESLGADSLDRFEFVMKLEEEFGVAIKDEEAEQLNTLGEAVDYIYNLKK